MIKNELLDCLQDYYCTECNYYLVDLLYSWQYHLNYTIIYVITVHPMELLAYAGKTFNLVFSMMVYVFNSYTY